MGFNIEKRKKVLGLGGYQPPTQYVCFLPFRGEFGWYLMTFVKRVQGYNHLNKIVCVKPGHEALFPTANKFFYDWQDVDDKLKAGIYTNEDEDIIKAKVIQMMGTDNIYFISPAESSWEEKSSLAEYTFIPKPIHNHNRILKVDVVLCPRKREMDAHRNWTKDKWQQVANELSSNGISVGVCGTRETSFHLENVGYKSYDYIDVDTDIELMLNAKLVVVQESGLQYLSFLCKRPTFCIDHYHKDFGADLHRDLNVPFQAMSIGWNNPMKLVSEIREFLKRTQ